MLTLTQECLVNNRKEWEEAGYALPQYDRIEMARETARNPKWIHFGAGNIFRAFQANLMQKLLNDGDEKAGIVAVDGDVLVGSGGVLIDRQLLGHRGYQRPQCPQHETEK